jgi:Holliday junction resolvase RusA-like endonuclease
MTTITFWAEGQPVPYNRESAKFGRTHPRNAAWRRAIQGAYLEAVRFNLTPATGPVTMAIQFYGARSGCDGDNLSKEVLDALNRCAYEDDSQIRRCVWEIADWRARGQKPKGKPADRKRGVMVTLEAAQC